MDVRRFPTKHIDFPTRHGGFVQNEVVFYKKPALGALAPIGVASRMHRVVWHTVRDSFEWNVYSEVTSGLARVFFRERNVYKTRKGLGCRDG